MTSNDKQGKVYNVTVYASYTVDLGVLADSAEEAEDKVREMRDDDFMKYLNCSTLSEFDCSVSDEPADVPDDEIDIW